VSEVSQSVDPVKVIVFMKVTCNVLIVLEHGSLQDEEGTIHKNRCP